MRILAGVGDDPGDEEAGENEEEIDAGPSPLGDGVESEMMKLEMTVVDEDCGNGESAKTVEFGDVGGKAEGCVVHP